MAKGKILVIDDELTLCELFCDSLKGEGYLVEYSLSSKEGIEKAKKTKFDVIITDLKMPDLDGLGVLKAIKEFDPDNIVIVHTGHPSFESVRDVLRAGAYDYITKPCDMDELSFVVKRSLTFRDLINTNKSLVAVVEEQNRNLEEKVKEKTRELRLLYNIGKDILSSLNLEVVLKTIVNNVSKILNVDICSILLVDKNEEFTLRYACGLSQELINQTRIQAGEGISGWVAQHKEPVLVEDIEKDPRFKQRNKEKYYNHSFISVPVIVKDKVIGVLNVNNKKSKEIFTKEDLSFIKGVANEAAIALENARLYTSLNDSYMRTISALTLAVDNKDHYTKHHSDNVTAYSVDIAGAMGLVPEEIKKIRQAAQLHDVGKIGIHDNILTKQGKLNKDEWEEMKSHPLKSAEILRPLTFLHDIIDFVEQHHERYDGTGYPRGAKGTHIVLGARIIAVADAYDAMTTDRPYRKALPLETAIAELRKNIGTQFDPAVIETFLKILGK